MSEALKTLGGWAMLIVGGLTLYRGYGIGWAALYTCVVGGIVSHGLFILFPWLYPDRVRESCTTVLGLGIGYLIASAVSSYWSDLSTMAGVKINTLIWWLSPWLGLLTFFAMVRISQIKAGKIWAGQAGFGTLTWALVFCSCVVLTFNSLLNPSAVGALYVSIGMRDKAVTVLTTTTEAFPGDVDARSLLKKLQEKQ